MIEIPVRNDIRQVTCPLLAEMQNHGLYIEAENILFWRLVRKSPEKELKDRIWGTKQFTHRNVEVTPAGNNRRLAPDRFDPTFTLLI